MNWKRTAFPWLVPFLILTFLVGQPQIFGQRLNLSKINWSEDSSRLWFQSGKNSAKASFTFVDCQSGQKHEVTPDLLADFVEGNDKDLKIEQLGFVDTRNEVAIKTNQGWYKYNFDHSNAIKIDRPESTSDKNIYFSSQRPSRNSQNLIPVQFVNDFEQDVEIFWIDTNGKPVSYGVIKAGVKYEIESYTSHVWLVKSQQQRLFYFEIVEGKTDYKLDRAALVAAEANEPSKSETSQVARIKNQAAVSPDQNWCALIQDHNLHIQNKLSAEPIPLTTDADKTNSFAVTAQRRRLVQMNYDAKDPRNPRPVVYWSPDSRYLVAVQMTRVAEPTVHFIESSPQDQLQPKLGSYPYAKPGDPIPQPVYRLFSVTGEELQIDQKLLENPFDSRFIRWSNDGQRFYLSYNQRGHKVVRIVEVSTTTGKTRAVFEDRSSTFIQYSDTGKSIRHWASDTKIIAASERSGWNHLYAVDFSATPQITPITSGEWNVKRLIHIDNQEQRIWFRAVGVHADQDPYHEHICRIDFDGSNFVVLTDSDGTYTAETGPQDRPYFIASYSRVDQPPIAELRSSTDGTLVSVLVSQKLPPDANPPVRFTAKGRDGKTDIWGIIHFPPNMDSNRKYPVVEMIYAGPHNHFVPKKYSRHYWHASKFHEREMILVQIDGMGTAWRSKAFHDVCYKNLRDGGFPDRIAWLQAASLEHPQMDLERVGIFGGSAGGQNALAALLWHHDFYSVAVADCGCHDNRMDKIWWNEQWMGWPVDESYEKSSNVENAHLLQGKLMLTVGELDTNVDPASTTQVVKQLIAAEKDFEFVLIPGAGHGAGELPWAAKKRLDFFARHLGGAR